MDQVSDRLYGKSNFHFLKRWPKFHILKLYLTFYLIVKTFYLCLSDFYSFAFLAWHFFGMKTCFMLPQYIYLIS